ncbi:MAG TPA: heavy metal-associated domain-containing protein [Candidatus Caenarcaniphilales bacterium]
MQPSGDQDSRTATLSEPATTTIVLEVGGMKCAGCAQAVEKQLAQHPGVVSASVNLVTNVATVAYEAGAVGSQELADDLTQAGFPASSIIGKLLKLNQLWYPTQHHRCNYQRI